MIDELEITHHIYLYRKHQWTPLSKNSYLKISEYSGNATILKNMGNQLAWVCDTIHDITRMVVKHHLTA